MSSQTFEPGRPSRGGSDPATDADYRIREVEARLDRRLTAVEAQRGRLRWMAGLMGVGCLLASSALAVTLYAVVPEDRTWTVASVSTQEVVLRDGDGVQRGLLATDDQGRAELTLSDRDGGERIRLTVLADGSPGVTISDPDARPRAVLGYLPDGTTNLVLADARGVSRAVFGLESDGSTRALFTDRAGTIRTLVGVQGDGEPSLSTYDAAESDVGPAQR